MEYPLGANRAAGACKPTHRLAVRSGIQKPVLRHPRVNAGSQKRPDTAQAEVFCAPGQALPARSANFFSLNIFCLGSQEENVKNSQLAFPHELAPHQRGTSAILDPVTARCQWVVRK